jgi:hypothetical protein
MRPFSDREGAVLISCAVDLQITESSVRLELSSCLKAYSTN